MKVPLIYTISSIESDWLVIGQYEKEDRCMMNIDFSNRCPDLVETTASTKGSPEIEQTEMDIAISYNISKFNLYFLLFSKWFNFHKFFLLSSRVLREFKLKNIRIIQQFTCCFQKSQQQNK